MARSYWGGLGCSQDEPRTFVLGLMHRAGGGVANDNAESLRWSKMAAVQGHGEGLCSGGMQYVCGWSVVADRADAIGWYKRATTAGESGAARRLKALSA